jgi:hypothetical protein
MFVTPLDQFDDIDNLFNADDLNPLLSNAATNNSAIDAFKTPSEELKEQVRRVVKDPAALQGMFFFHFNF